MITVYKDVYIHGNSPIKCIAELEVDPINTNINTFRNENPQYSTLTCTMCKVLKIYSVEDINVNYSEAKTFVYKETLVVNQFFKPKKYFEVYPSKELLLSIIKDKTPKKWHSNGTLWIQCNIINNKLENSYKKWNINGQIEIECNYENDKISGLYKEWYSNGQLKIESNYENGKLDGLYKKWYLNGQLAKRCFYKNDILENSYREWYSNGKLAKDFCYKNGNIDGVFEEYHECTEEKELKIKCLYNNGNINGKFEEYYPNGQLHISGFYSDGKKHGVFENYTNDGLLTSCSYNANVECLGGECYNGIKHGDYKEYHSNGNLKLLILYMNNVKDGYYKEWYYNGNIKIKCNYKNNVKHGKYKEFWNDFEYRVCKDGPLIKIKGCTKIQCSYDNDKIIGEYQEWYRNGKIYNKGIPKNIRSINVSENDYVSDYYEYEEYHSNGTLAIKLQKDPFPNYQRWDINGNII